MVLLNDEIELYIQEQISKFSNDKTNCIYDHIIHPPILKSQYPSIFLWSPIEHLKIQLLCPIHDTILQPRTWTADVTTPNSSKSPRIVYGVKKNFLLIQQLYFCYADKQHYFLSGSLEVLDLIEYSLWSNYFFLRKYHKSAFSRELIEYIFSEILNGVNFSKISYTLANFRRAEFFRDIQCADVASKLFSEHPLYFYPSSNGLKEVFLDIFYLNKEYYRSFNSIPKFSLSADHTFKVAKPIGGYSCEARRKLNRNFNKLFIVMCEDNQVADWKLTNTLTQSEIRPLLEQIHGKCIENGYQIKFIFSDLCCEWKKFYSSIFPDVDVKLDLFHAVQRVTKLLPNKKSKASILFGKKFGLIFREANDLGTVRCLPTPKSGDQLKNLDFFLQQEKVYIDSLDKVKKTAVLNEIEKIKRHIEFGCLSSIPPGSGTESNEGFHRLLNRSFMRGCTVLSPELGQAVLTLIFFAHNTKLLQRAAEDEFYPLLPLILRQKSVFSVQQEEYRSIVETSSTAPSPTTSILKKCTPRIITTIMKYTRNTVNNANTLKSVCNNRLFQEENILVISNDFFNNVSTINDDCQVDIFRKNSLSFNLCSKANSTVEGTASLFVSIAVLLKETAAAEDRLLWDRLVTYGIDKQMESQFIALILRDKFVETFKTSIWSQRFRDSNDYWFDSNISNEDIGRLGSIAIDVMSDVLGLGIVLVSSRKILDVSLHSPLQHQVSKIPLFLATLCLNTGVFIPLVENEAPTSSQSSSDSRCNCRSGSCQTNKCHCYKMKKQCTFRCYCRFCHNVKNRFTMEIRCSCGKNGNTVIACANQVGMRASKCPCLRNLVACGKDCRCKNCDNEFGKRENQSEDKEVIPRKKRRDTIYKPVRTEKYLEGHLFVDNSPWTFTETVCLASCYKIVTCFDRGFDTSKAEAIYNKVCDYAADLNSYGLSLKSKSENRIVAKIEYLKK